MKYALDGLVKRGVLLCDPGGGREASTYWIRDPREWHTVPWVAPRREISTRLDEHFGLRVRALEVSSDLASARKSSWNRARRRSANGAVRKPTWVARESAEGFARYAAPKQGQRAKVQRVSRATAHPSLSSDVVVVAGAPPPSLSSNVVYADGLKRGERMNYGLTVRAAILVGAVMEGLALDELRGDPLRRVKRVAAECNGEFDRLVGIARRLPAPARWVDRIIELEQEMVAPSCSAPIASKSVRGWSERERLERHLHELTVAGETEEAEEVRQRLATLLACESGSGA
ncbi:MAG: hypothetical protein ACYDDZ_11035 [Acidimicrobiales bacterium]